jgi:glycosyltransferase involved in cell wall biosynthesis
VIPQLDATGGAERQLWLLARALDRRRFLPTVVSLKHGGAWAERLRLDGVPVVELRRRRRFELSRLLGLWRTLRQVRPHLVVTLMFTANAYGRLLGLLAGAPRVISCERGGDVKTRVRIWIERALAPFTAAIVYNSRLNQEAAAGYRLRAPQLTIPNGAEIRAARPEVGRRILSGLSVPERARLIGAVARLHPGKGLDLFLDTARLLSHRPDLHFLVVGDGVERDRLQTRVAGMGLRDRFTFTGHLADPLPVMACLHVLVHPSIRDGMPNTLMEAMSLGVPCVSSAAGGIRELITDGVDGFVIEERSPASYADRVAALLDDPALASRLGAAAAERVRRDFSVPAMVRAYENLFEAVLRGDLRRHAAA